jgi:hypothetical protein
LSPLLDVQSIDSATYILTVEIRPGHELHHPVVVVNTSNDLLDLVSTDEGTVEQVGVRFKLLSMKNCQVTLCDYK